MKFFNENDTFAPRFKVIVDNNKDDWYNALLKDAEVESTDDSADKLVLHFFNDNGKISDAQIFSVGKEINFYGGYNDDLFFFGRYVIYSVKDLRVGRQQPEIEIIAFTKDYIMSKNEPKNSKSQPSNKTEKLRFVRVWEDIKDLSAVIKDIAGSYNFILDIDKAERSLMEAGTASISAGTKGKNKSKTPIINDNIVQPGGVDDLTMCSIIANEIGFLMWVDGDEDGNWTFHFKNPETTHIQKIGFDFHWNWEGNGSILEFDGEQLLEGLESLTVQFTDPKTKKLITVEVNPLNEDSITATPQNKKAYTEFSETEFTKDAIIKEPVAPNAIWLDIGAKAHKVITNRVFKSIEDVQAWATKYFKENGDLFKQSETLVPGAPDVLAFNVVKYVGLGGGWDGDHYIFKAVHKFSLAGYTTTIYSRKILGTDTSLTLGSTIDALVENPFVRKVKTKILETLNL